MEHYKLLETLSCTGFRRIITMQNVQSRVTAHMTAAPDGPESCKIRSQNQFCAGPISPFIWRPGDPATHPRPWPRRAASH